MANDLSKLSDAELDKMIQQHQDTPDHFAAVVQQPWTPDLIRFLTVSLLIFGLIIIGLMTYLVARQKDASDILRLFTLPMVIIAAVILVILGYSNEQMTPVIGLLGTMVGYILGANRRGNSESARPAKRTTTPKVPSTRRKK